MWDVASILQFKPLLLLLFLLLLLSLVVVPATILLLIASMVRCCSWEMKATNCRFNGCKITMGTMVARLLNLLDDGRFRSSCSVGRGRSAMTPTAMVLVLVARVHGLWKDEYLVLVFECSCLMQGIQQREAASAHAINQDRALVPVPVRHSPACTRAHIEVKKDLGNL